MNIFLDTHVLLWWLDDNPLLSKKVHSAIANSENLVVLSSVVIWEIRIKQALGKLVITPNFYDVLQKEGFEMLSITPDHAYAVGELPMHHQDPFDRMLIAQARLEGLTIATHDAVFKKYGVSVLDV